MGKIDIAENERWHNALIKGNAADHAARIEARAAFRAILSRVTKKLQRDNPGYEGILIECLEGKADEIRRERDALALAERKARVQS